MAQRLTKLERRGLVVREANPDDGRGIRVALSDSGRDLIEMALPDHLETERAIIAPLSVEEQKFLALILQKVAFAPSS